MKNLELYDPAMCCSTGVCGPSIDQNLLRVSTLVQVLANQGIVVKRHNLSQVPQDFVNNEVVRGLIKKQGVKALPITLLDGVIVKSGSYPTNKEVADWLGVSEDSLSSRMTRKKPNDHCCGGSSGCC